MSGLPFVCDDGGREAAGFRGEAGDCVTRAVAIATAIPYREVYEELARRQSARGLARSARNGVRPDIYRSFLEELGYIWTPTMQIGSGCLVHLSEELLEHAGGRGRFVVRLSRHLTAVVDGEIHDTFDPSREATRCVYGYWRQKATGRARPRVRT